MAHEDHLREIHAELEALRREGKSPMELALITSDAFRKAGVHVTVAMHPDGTYTVQAANKLQGKGSP